MIERCWLKRWSINPPNYIIACQCGYEAWMWSVNTRLMTSWRTLKDRQAEIKCRNSVRALSVMTLPVVMMFVLCQHCLYLQRFLCIKHDPRIRRFQTIVQQKATDDQAYYNYWPSRTLGTSPSVIVFPPVKYEWRQCTFEWRQKLAFRFRVQ